MLLFNCHGNFMLLLPNFFISGAARSGTTSMWQYLRQHPDIFMPPDFFQKEPSYFCHYRKNFGTQDLAQYLSLFQDAENKKMVGEASGPYLTSPESPVIIKQAIPQARFIIMLRNPAERAYSLYKWMHQYGFEKLPSFAEALRAEEQSRFDNADFKINNGQYYHNFLYFHSGLYCEQVKRFVDQFGPRKVQVIFFEEFIKNPLEHVRKTFEFLEVDPSFIPQIKVHNPSSPEYPAYDQPLRTRLVNQYSPDIRQLEQLLNRDLTRLWI